MSTQRDGREQRERVISEDTTVATGESDNEKTASANGESEQRATARIDNEN